MDKTWMDVLVIVIDALVGVAVGVGIPMLFSLIKARIHNTKAQQYIDRAQEYLASAVAMTNQVFVDQLKKDGEFNEENQAAAFQMAMDTWLKMLSDDMKKVIVEEVGNFEAWAEAKLEACVALLKEDQ